VRSPQMMLTDTSHHRVGVRNRSLDPSTSFVIATLWLMAKSCDLEGMRLAPANLFVNLTQQHG